jgi:eight transmembrane protein EpsH (proposed exosortase)
VIPSEKAENPAVLISGLVAGAVLVVVLGLLYAFNPYASGYGAYPVSVLHFASQLWKGEDWQHCYLVPLAVAAMVYYKRRDLHPEDLGTSWAGLAIAVFGLATYWLGFRADNIYLGYASFQILTGGLLLWMCGWKWFKTLFFAWAFLVFLYPVPFLDNVVAFPLRMIMSQASVTVLNLLGISAIKSGTAILSAPEILPGFKELKAGERFSVDVADPCSGIRSLFALMMVSALYGYFTQPGLWRKVVMFLCSMPLAVLGNLARILMLTIGTLLLGSDVAIGPPDDPSTFHMLAGFLVFGVAIMGLIGIGRLLNMDWPQALAKCRSFLRSQTVPPPPRPAPAAHTTSKTRRVQDEY